MSDLAITRLGDLLESGYHIARERSQSERIFLVHAGSSPALALLRCGTVEGVSAPLWPDYLSRANSIPPGADAQFGEFVHGVQQPSRKDEVTFHLERAISALPAVQSVARSISYLRLVMDGFSR